MKFKKLYDFYHRKLLTLRASARQGKGSISIKFDSSNGKVIDIWMQIERKMAKNQCESFSNIILLIVKVI